MGARSAQLGAASQADGTCSMLGYKNQDLFSGSRADPVFGKRVIHKAEGFLKPIMVPRVCAAFKARDANLGRQEPIS